MTKEKIMTKKKEKKKTKYFIYFIQNHQLKTKRLCSKRTNEKANKKTNKKWITNNRIKSFISSLIKVNNSLTIWTQEEKKKNKLNLVIPDAFNVNGCDVTIKSQNCKWISFSFRIDEIFPKKNSYTFLF